MPCGTHHHHQPPVVAALTTHAWLGRPPCYCLRRPPDVVHASFRCHRRHPRRPARINLSRRRSGLPPPPGASSWRPISSHPHHLPPVDGVQSHPSCLALPPPRPRRCLHATAHHRRRLEGRPPAPGRPDPDGRGLDMAATPPPPRPCFPIHAATPHRRLMGVSHAEEAGSGSGRQIRQ